MAGHIFCTPMGTFTDRRFDRDPYYQLSGECRKDKLSYGQADVLEGSIADFDLRTAPIPEEMRPLVVDDPKARSVGYLYSNIVCFSKIRYKRLMGRERNGRLYPGMEYVVEGIPNMEDDFGPYSVILLDMKEFLNRVLAAADEHHYDVLAGPVSYHPLCLGGKTVQKLAGDKALTICTEDQFDLADWLRRGVAVLRQRDAFDKSIFHADEREYRIVVNDKRGDEEPTFLEVGDLSDLVVPVRTEDVPEKVDRLLLQGKIRPSVDGFVGTVDRSQMRNDFYQLGHGKVTVAFMVGGATMA